MIIKKFNIDKNSFIKNKFILLHGANAGLKNEIIFNIISKNPEREVYRYDENEVFEKIERFYENILSQSLFGKEKIFIINKVTDKLLKIVLEIDNKKIESLFILNSETLFKNSKLRVFFEKNELLPVLQVYPDTNKELSEIIINFCKKKKILISQQNINLVLEKSGGQREHLKNELNKIESFAAINNKITSEILSKLLNLGENYSISELIDNCLSKKLRKTQIILNENDFGVDDSIIIIRTFLAKVKKIIKLSNEYEKSKNIDQVINNSKPPIFWKNKEIIKLQISKNSNKQLNELIFKLNELELNSKKNLGNSKFLITDFILNYSKR